MAGLTGAILGIGFDELTDSITLRGSGNGTANALTANNVANYGLIATSGDLTTNSGGNDVILRKKSGNRPTGGGDYREAEVVVDTTQLAQGKLPVRVYLQQGNNVQDQKKWIDVDVYNQMVAYYGSVQNIPSSFKLGFTGVAGASGTVDFHEIQGLTITSLQTSTKVTTGLPNTTTPEASTIQLTLGGCLLLGLTGLKRKGVRN